MISIASKAEKKLTNFRKMNALRGILESKKEEDTNPLVTYFFLFCTTIAILTQPRNMR